MITPRKLKSTLRAKLDERKFQQVPKAVCDTANLMRLRESDVKRMLARERFEDEWVGVLESTEPFSISPAGGGVNEGDRRILYQIVRSCNALNVLEIGTHIGASTLHIAAALRRNAGILGRPCSIRTVDIVDVNASSGPHANLGCSHTPKAMLEEAGLLDFVEFAVTRAQDAMSTASERFNVIFLDGDHSPAAVYAEIPLALKLLDKEGIVILHDYFPNGEPIWPGRKPLLGPYMAVQRHLREGADFQVFPVGEVGWSTKLGSRKSSLAILARPADL